MRLLHYRPRVANFGDDLNEEIWPGLVPALFGAAVPDRCNSAAFVGIGTIIGIDPGKSRELHIFSSGTGYTDISLWRDCRVTYHCVRGPITAQVLGLADDRALTDGAILAPLLSKYRSDAKVVGRVAVVPHYETIAFPGWHEAALLAGFDLVDPRDTPLKVLAALSSAALVLTESLHGAILADSFGVPWRPFAVSRNFSTAKWADWSASLGLDIEIALVPPPDPVVLFRFGKRPEPFGTMVPLDPEAALREFRHRVACGPSTPFLKVQAKRMIEALPAIRKLMGFSVQRTAQALSKLAAEAPFLSSAHRRDVLRDEMLHRLAVLAREQGEELAVS